MQPHFPALLFCIQKSLLSISTSMLPADTSVMSKTNIASSTKSVLSPMFPTPDKLSDYLLILSVQNND